MRRLQTIFFYALGAAAIFVCGFCLMLALHFSMTSEIENFVKFCAVVGGIWLCFEFVKSRFGK